MNYYSTEKRNRVLPEKPAMAITFVICLICWGISYFHSEGLPISSKILIYKEIAYIVGLLAVLTVGFVIQRINDLEMFVRERTRLPFMLFLLFFSTNAGLLPASEATIVIVCMVAFLYELFKSYQIPEATIRFFNASVYLGFAGLFVPQILFFVPLMWVGMYHFRVLELKSFLASLTGVMTVYWILLAWCVWTGDFSIYTGCYKELIHFNFFSVKSLFQYHGLALSGILILTVISCFYVKIDSFSNNVRTRMMLSFLINISVLSVILIFLYGDKADILQAVLYLSDAVLIAYFFTTAKIRAKLVLYYFMLILLLFSFISSLWSF
ncbi:MAG: hypothetical protein LBT50_10910 [Prevotellaceae bacterium]|jgi:hypothetical protein|nr:hypothetical protein [Prevotellaceae bacterium]